MADTMAGMIQQDPAMLQAQAMGEAGAAPQPTGMGGQDVSGGDAQAQFESVVAPLVDFVQGEGRQDIVQSLGATEDVGANSGSVISKMLLAQMQSAQRDANARIPAPVVAQSALQMSNILADIAVEEQLISEEMGDDIADDSFFNTLADIGEQAPEGLITPEDQQIFSQIISELEAAEGQRDSGGDSGGMGMNAGVGDGMGASNMSMAAMSAPGAPTETASGMNAGMYDGNPNGGSLNG